MQPRMLGMEEGKDQASVIRTNISRTLPLRLLLFCLLFAVMAVGLSIICMYSARFFIFQQTGNGPLPLTPLWDKFFKGNQRHYSIYVHALPSYVAGYPQSSAFHGRQIPSQMVEWGKMTLSITGRGRYDPRMEPEVELSQWRKGAQWFEVNRRLAINIIEDVKYYSKFKEFLPAGLLCGRALFHHDVNHPSASSLGQPDTYVDRLVEGRRSSGHIWDG
ncbi:hypothetical protein F3Y22_tig00000340pilonHSYRG00873 [Hibiscus syriacus]|uniref:Uncharacterized protein n=1 Tax=Hibiscus syriacus TaxID=106335 RepID=A0A6A3D8V2_HIBSY|nr:hypothetical protein F3Y22_tig00000340pilonHSYRG00873 [Hibiscus syriacus]